MRTSRKPTPLHFGMSLLLVAMLGAKLLPGPSQLPGTTTTEHAWRELLMLPQCVLCAPPRGGRKHRRAVAAYTRDRLQRWLDGERRGLWESRHVPAARSVRKHSAAERRAFATALAREGYERRACAALLSEGLSPQTATTAEALRALPPSSPPASA